MNKGLSQTEIAITVVVCLVAVAFFAMLVHSLVTRVIRVRAENAELTEKL